MSTYGKEWRKQNQERIKAYKQKSKGLDGKQKAELIAQAIADGTYKVSKKGDVWRFDPVEEKYKPVRQWLSKGYMTMVFAYRGIGFRIGVHRFLYICYNGPILEGLQCDHKNENKLDNRLRNLQLLIQGENMKKSKKNRDLKKKKRTKVKARESIENTSKRKGEGNTKGTAQKHKNKRQREMPKTLDKLKIIVEGRTKRNESKSTKHGENSNISTKGKRWNYFIPFGGDLYTAVCYKVGRGTDKGRITSRMGIQESTIFTQ